MQLSYSSKVQDTKDFFECAIFFDTDQFYYTDELNLKQIAHDDLVRSCNLTQTENDI